MSDNWALRAIEDAAMSRAFSLLGERAHRVPETILGLTKEQIIWLIYDYETRTGNSAFNIDPRAPAKQV